MRPSSRAATLCASLTALALLTSCGSHGSGVASSSEPATAPSTTVELTTPAPTTQTKNWFDLAVGDCVTEIPAIDTGVVSTTVVSCSAPHQAEVFLLAPLAVDTAINQVAMTKCAKGFVDYTGQPFVGNSFAVTYLIDSNQDRTANNPTPSTAICLLQAADGTPLTKSPRF